MLRPEGERFVVLSCIAGACAVSGGGVEVPLDAGLTCLAPAELAEVRVRPVGEVSLLQAYGPDLRRNVVEPSCAAGFRTRRPRGSAHVRT